MNQVMGVVMCFAGPYIPRNWAPCDGQALFVSQHPALFKLIGTTYGGDGIHTFNLPDLRGRTAVSAGRSPFRNYRPGEPAGSETVQLNMNQVPAHTHNGNIELYLAAAPTDAIESAVNDAYPARHPGAYSTAKSTITAGDKTVDVTMAQPDYTDVSIGNAGSSTPVDIRSPFLVITHIICLSGIFPARS